MTDLTQKPGHLFLVVGPSGAGKDSLIGAAARRFAGRSDIYFPRRFITRPAGSGGEDHRPLTVDAFHRMDAAKAFAFSWGAHDLFYGVPADVNDRLRAGHHVIVNTSRSIIHQQGLFISPVTVLSIQVERQELARRLRARGRESESSIQKRLDRASAWQVTGPNVVTIDNSVALDAAEHHFINAIEAVIRSMENAVAS